MVNNIVIYLVNLTIKPKYLILKFRFGFACMHFDILKFSVHSDDLRICPGKK